MTQLLTFLSSGPGLAILFTGISIAALITIAKHDSFWFTDFGYRFPFIGKLARYSKDYSETKRDGWLNAEAALCHDYARHVTCLPKSEFENHSEYLRKSYDHGRKPIPGLIFVLLSVLVLLEGLGFSYLLSSWMALEGSANDRRLLTVAIVTVLSAILVWVTHTAGHQLYRTRLLRGCFQQFQAEGLNAREKLSGTRRYTSKIIALKDDQDADDDQPDHVQCANRVATTPNDVGSYAWVWVAGFLVLFIAVLSTILRIETLHSTDAAASAAPVFPGLTQQVDNGGSFSREMAALSSFWILAVIFVVTQIVGMGVGFRYGFASKQGAEAYAAIRGCPNYESYFAPIRRRMDIAGFRLTTLHRLMERRLPKEIDWERTFLDHIREQRAQGAKDLQDPGCLDDNEEASAPGVRTGQDQQADGSETMAKRVRLDLAPGADSNPANDGEGRAA